MQFMDTTAEYMQLAQLA